MSVRGRPEEKIYTGPRWSSGLIDIVEGPIRWVNFTTAWIASVGEDSDMPEYLVHGIPDPKVRSGFPKVRVNAVAVRKSFFRSGWWKYEALGSRGPGRKDMELLGPRQVIGARWKGNDFGLGIKQHLSQTVMVPRELLDSLHIGSFEIRAHIDRGCWSLIAKDVLSPSKEEWDFYQSVASYLVGTPLRANT